MLYYQVEQSNIVEAVKIKFARNNMLEDLQMFIIFF